MNTKYLWVAVLGAALSVGLAGCEKEGSLERAGEEVDEAVDTMKNGEESTSSKMDDAVDEVREGARETTEEARD